MIKHIDRVPVNPNRKLITPEGGGTPYYATVTYADNATETGTPINKALLDEFLSATGTTTGTSDALLLAQDGFSLVDGATIRFKLHVDMSKGATINVNSTGAISIVDPSNSTIQDGNKAGSWLTAVYSSTFNKYVLQNGKEAYNVGNIKLTVGTEDSTWALCNGAKIRRTSYPDLFNQLTSTTEYYYSSWTTATGLNSIYGLKYVNGKYFFWGLNSSGYCTISYATELSKSATWTTVIISASTQTLTNFVYANGFYFGFFNSSYAFFSSTLTNTWAYVTTAASGYNIYDVAYGGGAWAFIGYNVSNNGLGMINTTSSLTNGTNTTLTGLTAVLGGYGCKNIIYDGTRWVTAGLTSDKLYMCLYYTTNPATVWTASSTTYLNSTTTSVIEYFTYENGQYIVGGHVYGGNYDVWIGYSTTYNGTLTYKAVGLYGTSMSISSIGYANGYYFLIMYHSSGHTYIRSCSTVSGTYVETIVSGIGAYYSSPPIYVNGEYIIALNSSYGYVIQTSIPTGDQKALPTLTATGVKYYIKLI